MGVCFHRALWLYCIVEKHKKVSNGAVLVNIHHPVHKWPKMHHLIDIVTCSSCVWLIL